MSQQTVSLFGNTSPIIILGVHRSGTSALAGILAELGVHMGDKLDIHNEAIVFKDINRALLYRYSTHWANPEPFVFRLANPDFIDSNCKLAMQLLREGRQEFASAALANILWGWKDPRTTLTLPIWLKLFPSARIIHVYRHGFDVSLSLYRRELKRALWLAVGGKSSEKMMWPPTVLSGYRLWEKYVRLELAHQTNLKLDWLTIRYEDILTQPIGQIDRLCNFLGQQLSKSQQESLVQKSVWRPKRRSILDRIQLYFLFKMGLIDTSLLDTLGYKK